MSAPAFTPGPWEVVRDGPAFPLAVHAALDGDVDGDTGRHVIVGGDLIAAMADASEDEANANLISASPDLYEALVSARDAIRVGGVTYAEMQNQRAKIDAALRKARGAIAQPQSAHLSDSGKEV